MGWTVGNAGSGQSASSTGQLGEGQVSAMDVLASTRTYYIAADRVNWDYAPSQRMRCYPDGFAAMPAGVTRIGGVFVKTQYREYTDATFKVLKPRGPDWVHLGSLGPALYAEVGQVLVVVFRNNLPFPVNVAPTGGLVIAPHVSGGLTSATFTEAVPPGRTVTYHWAVPELAGPVPGATVSSRMWLYRSSVDPVVHDNAGLIGPIIVAGRGQAGPDGRARDVDRDVVSVFAVVEERSSPFAAQHDPQLTAGASFTKNMINGWEFCNMPAGAITLRTGERVRWHVSSVGNHDGLHNFHWHGHLVELNGHHVDQFTGIPTASYSVNMVPDEPGNWFFHCHVNKHMGGGMVDMYTVQGPRAPLPPSTGVQRVYYIAAEEQLWDYVPLGADYCSDPPKPFTPDSLGYTYLSGPWAGSNTSTSAAAGANRSSTPTARLGSRLTKTLYVQYTDATFTTPAPRTAATAYLGFTGPIIRANVGDTIKVMFLNRARMPTSIHAHGVRYTKANEGTLYDDGSDPATEKADDVVAPGQNYTYTWHVRETSGPGPRDPSSLLWIYHGHVDEAAETNAGLMGGIIITGRGMARSAINLTPVDVDRELVILMTVTNETASSNFKANLQTADPSAASNPAALSRTTADPDFQAHMLKHSINGFMYCNLPHLNFTVGERVRLHIMSFGSVEDTHSVHLGGPRFDYNRHHSDAVQVSPGGMISADVAFTAPGNYELQCRMAHHINAGMRARYTVLPKPADPQADPQQQPQPAAGTPLTGVTRAYFIQAEPLEWDYAPAGYQKCTETDLSGKSAPYLLKSSASIGSKYRKAVYREYTDESFTVRKPGPDYTGLVGPLVVAEVGDRLEVHFRNALTDLPHYPVNLAPGGGLVEDGSDAECEGGAPVAAGGHCVYRWIVPDTAGPGLDDVSTVAYGYTSSVDVASAPNLGLVGALVVAGRGELQPPVGPGAAPLPGGVDFLVPLYFQVMDENASPYLAVNAKAAGVNLTAMGTIKDGHSEHGTTNTAAHQDEHSTHMPGGGSGSGMSGSGSGMNMSGGGSGGMAMEPADFMETNRMHAINGYVYCNLPRPAFPTGSLVRWVLMAYGSESEFHSPYFTNHDTQVDRFGWSTLASLMPATIRTADMRAGAPGNWLMFCDVHHDYMAGMMAEFRVLPDNSSSSSSSSRQQRLA
ncbi:hypothetical protein HYH02_001632 [Chlamydomonas schloesseri]|uniref:Multicopper oxidase n=1 Tax=Chlamydomonas schloesseri TaxID=2026947 RepID=A0A835WU11_9CHLO|nr:hypothetical protein HYH02_001632 [Chlamydomonas schloesseri]|eukprot:KAG2453409.1 hypothetical protein HYH02_001632 [Chlamydomonas schloesseri]